MGFSCDYTFSDQQQQTHLPMNFTQKTQSFSNSNHPNIVLVDHHSMSLAADNFHLQDNKEKRKGGTKRKRERSKDANNTEEVIHVRAKRGQATDSHSLAERVRRKKINDRLKCLQTLVPGCYKTMGMAVMLDVVISYVQSLQNQIEFLSMKLSAASMYYDFSSASTDTTNAIQVRSALMTQGTNALHVNQKFGREAYGGFSQSFH